MDEQQELINEKAEHAGDVHRAEQMTLEALPDGDYAIVECMGHSTIIGRVMEVERFGTKMLQIEPIFCGKLLGPMLQAGGSLYRFTPCTKEIALKRAPTSSYNLPPAIAATLPPLALTAEATIDHHEFDDEEKFL